MIKSKAALALAYERGGNRWGTFWAAGGLGSKRWRRARQEEEADGNEKDKESKDCVCRQLIRVGCFGKGGEQEKDSAAVIILGLEMIDDDDYAMAKSSMFHLGFAAELET